MAILREIKLSPDTRWGYQGYLDIALAFICVYCILWEVLDQDNSKEIILQLVTSMYGIVFPHVDVSCLQVEHMF